MVGGYFSGVGADGDEGGVEILSFEAIGDGGCRDEVVSGFERIWLFVLGGSGVHALLMHVALGSSDCFG